MRCTFFGSAAVDRRVPKLLGHILGTQTIVDTRGMPKTLPERSHLG